MDNRPKLIMMVGLAGAGKSAIAQQIANNIDAEIISSDEIRKEFCKDVNDQSKNGFVFNEMYKKAKQLLKNNKNVILDSTNLKACNRKVALEWFKHIDCIKFAYIIATPFEKCLANNKHRKRSIPEEVIKHQRETFQIPFYEEGFDAIFIDRENEDLKKFEELIEKFEDLEYLSVLAQDFKDDKIKYKATFLLDYGKFFTTDINKNGKPELIVKYGGVETDCSIWVYEYKGGKYKKAKGAIYDTCHPTLHNYMSGNGLVLQERPISEYDCESVTLVTLSKGRIKRKIVRERYLSFGKQRTTMPCKIKTYTP